MMDLDELPFGRYEFAVWAGGHVTAGQHAGKNVRGRLELQAQDVGKSALAAFDDGVGVMCDQPAQHGVGVPEIAQVTGAVECMQARHGQAGRLADVVQPRGGLQEISVRAKNRRQDACPGGNTLEMRLVAGEGSWRAAGRDARPMRPACVPLSGDQFAALGAALGCVQPGAGIEVVRAAVLGELGQRTGGCWCSITPRTPPTSGPGCRAGPGMC